MRERGSYYHLKWTIIGPPAKGHLNGVSLAGRWWPTVERWLGSFVIFQRIWTSIAKELHSFVIFKGVGGGGGVRTPCPPSPLDLCMAENKRCHWQVKDLLVSRFTVHTKNQQRLQLTFLHGGATFLRTFAWLLSLCLLVLITFANSLGPDQAWQNVRLCLDPNCLTYWKNY